METHQKTCNIKINGNEHSVPSGARLVNVIEETGYDISHRCGGNAKCTTCKVDSNIRMPKTQVELTVLNAYVGIGGLRLSCQMLTQEGLEVTVLNPVSEMEWDEPGPTPDMLIQPEPVFLEG